MFGSGYAPMLRQQQHRIDPKLMLAQTLAQSGANKQATTPLGALDKVAAMGLSGFMQYQAAQEQEQRQKAMQETLAKALQAGQGTPAIPDAPGPNLDGSAGYTVPAKAGDVNALASILSSNPDTAEMGLGIAMNESARRADDARFDNRFAMQSAKEDARFEKQLAASREDRAADREYRDAVRQDEQQFRKEMLGAQRGMQREPVIAVMGPNGPMYVPQSQAVGMTPYNMRASSVNLSPTAQKELFEADELAQQSGNVIGLLDQALALNDKAYSGGTAQERAALSKYVPDALLPKGAKEGADASIDMDNIIRGQALESLKATFGGMPTEGERKVLLELQASLEKTPEQRAAILNRAKEMAAKRLEFNRQKAQSLRSGDYFQQSPMGGAQARQGGLSPDEEAELLALRARFGR